MDSVLINGLPHGGNYACYAAGTRPRSSLGRWPCPRTAATGLYARRSAYATHGADATYSVARAGAMTAVQVDRRGSGGIWVPRAAQRAN